MQSQEKGLIEVEERVRKTGEVELQRVQSAERGPLHSLQVLWQFEQENEFVLSSK